MTLTMSDGPLASSHPGAVNYTIDGPKHLLFASAFPRRVRYVLGGETVLDSENGVLLHESNLLPVLYVPREDVRGELARDEKVTHCPFKGDATHYSLAGVSEAVWGYEEPLVDWLEGRVAFYADKLDSVHDEDEEVRGHLRDPYHRTDVRPRGDVLVLSETGLPNRIYAPRESVTQQLERSETTSHCPYKGDATYWHVDGRQDAAWSYEEPYDSVRAIAGHICFDS